MVAFWGGGAGRSEQAPARFLGAFCVLLGRFPVPRQQKNGTSLSQVPFSIGCANVYPGLQDYPGVEAFSR